MTIADVLDRSDNEMFEHLNDVRLVIWDLDETFWKGTLTEGGIEYSQTHHDIVIKLAQRGIMNSICSKNDFDPVQRVLTENGLWDYFVFPSINWGPKGPRIKQIIESFQLRAQTILFIDDNVSNRHEALAVNPEIQVANESIAPLLLSLPGCRGKDDYGLERLKQYKLLERKTEDRSLLLESGASNVEFLRESQIKIRFDYNVEKNIDRAIELINRTNQLNFTKRRLPEDITKARVELLEFIRQYDVQSALVDVSDRYGAYGYVGFYAIKTNIGRPHCVHFCFSCRTLGMGIEDWTYRHIGKPELVVVGEVINKFYEQDDEIDWISIDLQSNEDINEPVIKSANAQSECLIRGGCNGLSIAHYFHAIFSSVTTEVASARNGVPIRSDHSLFLTHFLDHIDPKVMMALELLGYNKSDFETQLFNKKHPGSIVVLDLWTDSEVAIYKHKQLGFRIPFLAPYHFNLGSDSNAMALPADFTAEGFPLNHPFFKSLEILRTDYVYEGLISEALFKENLNRILSNISGACWIFVLLSNETWLNPGNNLVYEYPAHKSLNHWTIDVAQQFSNVITLNVREFILSDTETDTVNHFHRLVYFRIYKKVIEHLNSNQIALGISTNENNLAEKVEAAVDEEEDINATLKLLKEKLKNWNQKHGHPFPGVSDGLRTSIENDLMQSCQAFSDRDDLLKALPKNCIFAEIGKYSGDVSVKIVKYNRPSEFHIFDWNFDSLTTDNRRTLDLYGSVQYHSGDPNETFVKLEEGFFDVVYLNKSKDYGSILKELDYCRQRIKKHGFLVVNDFTSWDPVQGIPYGVMPAVAKYVNEMKLKVAFISLHPRGFMNIALQI